MTDPTPQLAGTCPAVAELIVGGHHAGWLRCSLDIGHDQRSAVVVGDTLSELHVLESNVMPDDTVLRWEDGAPHRAIFEWADDPVVVEDWPEALDANETFDVDVPDLPSCAGDEHPLAHFCPECVAGKHGNCDGGAWCNRVDEAVPCRCACRVLFAGRVI